MPRSSKRAAVAPLAPLAPPPALCDYLQELPDHALTLALQGVWLKDVPNVRASCKRLERLRWVFENSYAEDQRR